VASESAFGRLGFAEGPLDRMSARYLNAPQDFLPARNFMGALLARTLNRLVNEAVQRRFVLPLPRRRAPAAALNAQNTNVSRREAAEQFLHVSQRAFWRRELFEWATLRVAPLAGQLRQKLREFFFEEQWLLDPEDSEDPDSRSGSSSSEEADPREGLGALRDWSEDDM
jgi:hypothetical protein